MDGLAREELGTHEYPQFVAALAGLATSGVNDHVWRDLVNALPAAVYITDATGRIIFFNEAAVTLWDCRPELGKSEFWGSWRMYWPDGTPLPHDQCPMAMALKEKRPIRGMEAIAERPDGTRIHFIPYPTPLFDASGNLIGAVNMLVDITERRQAQARQEMLTRELHHRTKNLFAVVQSVVARSFAGKGSVKDAETAVKNRLRSLAETHALLVEKDWQGADLAAVVRIEMSPYPDRVTMDGPTVMLTAQAAQNFALAVHELATNAAKYGALSNQTGHVHISWSVLQSSGDSQFSFRWQERGGPPVAPPTGKGFGAIVLEQVMAGYFAVPPRIEFAPSGICYELKGSLEAVTMRLH